MKPIADRLYYWIQFNSITGERYCEDYAGNVPTDKILLEIKSNIPVLDYCKQSDKQMDDCIKFLDKSYPNKLSIYRSLADYCYDNFDEDSITSECIKSLGHLHTGDTSEKKVPIDYVIRGKGTSVRATHLQSLSSF